MQDRVSCCYSKQNAVVQWVKSLSSSSCGSVRLWCFVQQLHCSHRLDSGDVEPTTVARKSGVACGGCRAGRRVAGDAELGSQPGAITDDVETNTNLAEEKAIAVAAKKKERSELRGELKKRQSKHEKEHAEKNSQKLIAKWSADGQFSVTRVRDSARVMRIARLPCELELRQSASQSSTRDVR